MKLHRLIVPDLKTSLSNYDSLASADCVCLFAVSHRTKNTWLCHIVTELVKRTTGLGVS